MSEPTSNPSSETEIVETTSEEMIEGLKSVDQVPWSIEERDLAEQQAKAAGHGFFFWEDLPDATQVFHLLAARKNLTNGN